MTLPSATIVIIGTAGRRLALGLAAALCSACAHAQDTMLVEHSNVAVPSYSDAAESTLVSLYSSKDEYEAARADKDYIFERLVYRSDGLNVVAFLYRSSREPGPRPTIVFNRGSYVRNGAAPELLALFHRFGEAGFTVIAPMYRGSEGGEGRDEMGGEDLNDLTAIANLVGALPSADAEKMFLYGESRGGMMVLQALRDGFPALAAATFGAPTDFHALFEQQPEVYEPVADAIWPGWRENRSEYLGRRSAVQWAESISAPLLVMHGAQDESMPVSQSIELVSRLDALGKPYEFVVYGYDDHVLSGHSTERDARAAAWFRRHLSQ